MRVNQRPVAPFKMHAETRTGAGGNHALLGGILDLRRSRSRSFSRYGIGRLVPPGTRLDCNGTNPMRPPMCRCVATGSWSGPASQGRAEIKRKTVPQVQPSKTPH